MHCLQPCKEMEDELLPAPPEADATWEEEEEKL
jgi:hypothetical protein